MSVPVALRRLKWKVAAVPKLHVTHHRDSPRGLDRVEQPTQQPHVGTYTSLAKPRQMAPTPRVRRCYDLHCRQAMQLVGAERAQSAQDAQVLPSVNAFVSRTISPPRGIADNTGVQSQSEI